MRCRMAHSAANTSRPKSATGALAALCAAAIIVVGCGKPGNFETSFRLNSQGEDLTKYDVTGAEKDDDERKDKEFNKNGRQYIVDALAAMFGTPDDPYVFRETGLDLRKIRMASGPAGGLPAEKQQARLTDLRNREKELKASQPKAETAVKEQDSAVMIGLTKFATDNNLQNIKTPADLKEKEADFKKTYSAVLTAKAAADKSLAETSAELADLDVQIKSYGVAQKGLYRKHCGHCHGTTGDGAGPTAAFLVPYPRDYRQGVFKFKSTQRASRPTSDDLKRVLLDGINDTAMPSFSALLAPDEVEALVEYVKYLAIRGEAEAAMRDQIINNREAMKPSRSELVSVALQSSVDAWKEAETAGIAPVEGYKPDGDRKAWLKAGETIFMGDKAKCFSCHGTTALGDGRKKSEPLYDVWNKDKAKAHVDLAAAHASLQQPNLTAEQTEQIQKTIRQLTNVVASYNLPTQNQLPRNLRVGKYRFGRSPVDIYRRIFAGINGTEMPAGGKPGPLSEKEIWQLVDYVLSLPYELNEGLPGASSPDTHHAGLPLTPGLRARELTAAGK